MGRVKNLLISFINTVEETLSERVQSLSAKPEGNQVAEKIKEPPSLSEDECLLLNKKSDEENTNIIKVLDYKTYLLLSIVPNIKIDENEPESALKIFTSEQLLMENWLEHLSNFDRIKKFQKLIRPTKVLPDKNSITRRNIKCLRDLPLQKQTLN